MMGMNQTSEGNRFDMVMTDFSRKISENCDWNTEWVHILFNTKVGRKKLCQS